MSIPEAQQCNLSRVGNDKTSYSVAGPRQSTVNLGHAFYYPINLQIDLGFRPEKISPHGLIVYCCMLKQFYRFLSTFHILRFHRSHREQNFFLISHVLRFLVFVLGKLFLTRFIHFACLFTSTLTKSVTDFFRTLPWDEEIDDLYAFSVTKYYVRNLCYLENKPRESAILLLVHKHTQSNVFKLWT